MISFCAIFKFCALIHELHLPQKFCLTHRDSQTDKRFLEIIKSCSGHPKTRKSIKNQKLKNFMKLMLSSTYKEESKKRKEGEKKNIPQFLVTKLSERNMNTRCHLSENSSFFFFLS